MLIKKRIIWTPKILNLLCTISTISILHNILKYSNYGIDFTDEGFYLNSISNPFIYKATISQFGFIYNPIYNFLDNNITWLRRFNFIIIFLLSCLFLFLIINKIIYPQKINKINIIILSTGISVSSFTYVFIQTPSYNHLVLQSILITCIGVLLIDEKNFKKNFLAYIVISVGIWLTFMAKPSSAIGLILLICINLFLSQKLKLKFLLTSLFTIFFLFFISAMIIDGSITKFLYRYFLSIEILRLMQSGHEINSIFRIDELNLSLKIKISILVIFSITLFCYWLEYCKFKLTKYILIIFYFIFFIFIISVLIFRLNWNPNYGYYQPYQFLGIVLACIIIFLFFLSKNIINFKDIKWNLFFLFIIMPYISALGSNNNYWLQSGIASIFWLIAGFILIIPLSLRIKKFQPIFIILIISQIVTAIHLKEKIEEPYRNNKSLRFNNSKIIINNNNHFLKVSSEFAKYVQDAKVVVKNSGFTKGEPVIDLTGQSPGLLYLINAKSVGAAWIIGGYKGSNEAATIQLSLVSCKDISNSWILYEINGPRSISAEVMNNLGAKFPDQYELMGYWNIERKVRGFNETRVQELYKPSNSLLIFNNCIKLKKNE